MLRKLPVFILLAAAAFSVSFGQQAPEAQKSEKTEREKKAYGVFFDGSASYLGVQTVEVNKENYAKYGLSGVRGVAVEKVVENSPAAQAGLQKGDVIVKFNGEDVTGTRKLTRLIAEVAPDHQAVVTVLRNGAERDLNVTMGKRELPQMRIGGTTYGDFSPMIEIPVLPRIQSAPFPPTEGSDWVIRRLSETRQIGITVTNLSKQLADYFGVADGKGLLIESVRENSPAAKAGLKAGDVIVEIDGKQVKDSLELVRALNEKREGSVNLTIVREKNRQTIIVTPETVKSNLPLMPDGIEG